MGVLPWRISRPSVSLCPPMMGACISASAFHDGLLIKSVGKGAHAMMPETGVNAQTALLAVLVRAAAQ